LFFVSYLQIVALHELLSVRLGWIQITVKRQLKIGRLSDRHPEQHMDPGDRSWALKECSQPPDAALELKTYLKQEAIGKCLG